MSFLRSSVLLCPLLLLAGLMAPASAEDRRPADAVPAVTPPSEMARSVVETEPPRATGRPVARDLSDPRDGNSPGSTVRGLDPQEERYVELAKRWAGEIGGDDVLVTDPLTELTYGSRDVAIASNGDIYVGISYYTSSPDFEEYIGIYRSTDGGSTFALWGQIGFPGGGDDARLVSMCLAEGAQNRLYVQYMRHIPGTDDFDQHVAYATLGSSTATWTTRTLFAESGVSHLNGQIASDAITFSSYYLYAVCSGIDGNGDDIWYTRSTDQGNSWSAPFRIATLSHSGNLMYSRPRITYAFGGNLHVAWTYTERLQSTIDDGVRTRRATNYGAAFADFDGSVWALRFVTDGINQRLLDIEASTTNDEVIVVCGESGFGYSDPHAVINVSAGGADWNLYGFVELPWDEYGELAYDPDLGDFMAVGLEYADGEAVVVAAQSASGPEFWPGAFRFGDTGHGFAGRPDVALDPSRSNQLVTVFPPGGSLTSTTYFDAQWRDGPGYPTNEPGFPVDVGTLPTSPPAIAQVDDDPYGEIVYGDNSDDVWVVSHEGTVPGGWPRNVPGLTGGAPIAVGPVDGSGEAWIVAGSNDGKIYAFERDGTMREGFPVDLGTGKATYPAIGAIGPPYERWIVAASGDRIYWISYRGEVNTTTWNYTIDINHPIAIGDVDADGIAEIVTLKDTSSGGYLHTTEADPINGETFRWFGGERFSGAPTLFDLDGDGDLEIGIPTTAGNAYVVHHDGTDVAGFPYNNGTGYPLTEIVAANFIGTFQPDLAFCSQDAQVHVLFYDGVEQSSYPEYTDTNWWIFGAPIVDQVNRTSANVIVGSRDRYGWSFQNTGNAAPGWPKFLDDQVHQSPASGDIDLDGRNEIVFLGNEMLHVVDVNYPAETLPQNKWPMWGYDSERTNCLNCKENADATPASPATASRVSFAPPSPNPSSGSLVMQYQLPSRATVALEVFDLRGRRVRTVVKEEASAGPHMIGFDGRDQGGAELASGQYFARLRVKGPGVDQVLTRKFSLLR